MDDGPHYLEDKNLSRAWARAYLSIFEAGEIQPLTVTVTEFAAGTPLEDPSIRAVVDEALRERGLPGVNTIASTIFPAALWHAGHPRSRLYRRYKRILPRLLKHSGNRHGTYFQRLIAFGPQEINQLEHVIETWTRGNHRRSALTASLIDPSMDHTHQRRRGFPCLQQVCFVPVGTSGLAVTGFYAMQYMLERAYGNYVGLVRLGHFVATEMSRELVRMTCVASVCKRDAGIPKRSLCDIVRTLETIINAEPLDISDIAK